VSLPNAATVAQHVLDESRGSSEQRIVVTTGDSATRAPGGSLTAELDRALYFASDSTIIAVVGPGGSRPALQTAPVYRDAHVPNVIPTSTSTKLRDLGAWTFLLAPNDSIQGAFIGTFAARQLGAHTAAIFYIPDEYGVGLATGTAAALASHRITLLARVPVRPEQLCPPRAPHNPYEDAVVAAMKRGTPDVIILAARTLETACIARAVYARAPGTRLIAGDGALVDRGFASMAGPAADSIYLVAFWHQARPDSASRAFVERFRAVVKREPRHDDAMFYDAVMLVATAIRAVGPIRNAVRQYLADLGGARPPYHGVTGSIAFTGSATGPLLMTRLRAGSVQLVESP
jgi:ABC-type branched-subunit amino acid transport system substrate-binding protein